MKTFHEVLDTREYVKSAVYQSHLAWARERAGDEGPWPPGNELFRQLRSRLPALRRKARRVD